MAVILRLRDGSAVRLDRNLRVSTVAADINEGRARGLLMEFPNDLTPSRPVWVDPADVMRIEDDR